MLNTNGFDVSAFVIFVGLVGIYSYCFGCAKIRTKILIILFALPMLCTLGVKITTDHTESCGPNIASEFLYLSIMLCIMIFIPFDSLRREKNAIAVVMGHTLLNMYFTRFTLICSSVDVPTIDVGAYIAFAVGVSICNYSFYCSLATDHVDTQYDVKNPPSTDECIQPQLCENSVGR
jgi:hypothetical protein